MENACLGTMAIILVLAIGTTLRAIAYARSWQGKVDKYVK
jgi:hypothetical protein